MEGSAAMTVRVLSRRMVKPSYGVMPMPPSDDIHLTPWDLYGINAHNIERGILLPKPPAGGEISLADALASSLARTLGRYYHFAGRLAMDEHGDGTVTVALHCTGEGAELVQAVAPSLTVADVVGSGYTPSPVVREFFRLNGVCGARVDMANDWSLPVLSAQVTELADGVFIGMSMNHTVGDGTCFWHLFNLWSAINRGDELTRAPAPAPEHRRWFVETSPVPISFPFSALQQAVQQLEIPHVRVGFFTFSAAMVKKLKARANQEMAAAAATATATISSFQALLAHLWRAVTRARCLPPEQETFYIVIMGCRGRIRSISPGYIGNAVAFRRVGCSVGGMLDKNKGLGWTAWQLNRAVASFDEAATLEWLDRWVREPTFLTPAPPAPGGSGFLVTTSSPRFDMFGNDFGWGKPVGVWSGPGNKKDGVASVFEGPDGKGSMSLEVSLVPQVMERLIADHEFMETVTVPPA